MKILQISPKLPYPANDGGAIGIFNITKFLSILGHHITFLTFARPGVAFGEFEKYCKIITVQKDTSNSIIGLLKNFFSSAPYTSQKYYSKEMVETIDKLMGNDHFDIVHIDHLHISNYGKYIKKKYKTPVVLREHNFETRIWERLAKNERNILKKIIYSHQYSKVRKYEPEMCSLFDKCLMVSRNDLERLKVISGNIRMDVAPAGVDIEYLSEKYTGNTREFSILFVGALDWYPNIDAFIWFYEKIFLELKRRFPKFILNVIGKNPPRWILDLKDKNIAIHGMVEDVRPYIDQNEVCVVPLRIGGGMRIKILEMFAMKKAVVSTGIGCEGIDVENEKHLLIADNEKQFIDSISRFFMEESLRKEMGENGYSLVNEKYRWDKIAEKIEKIYLEIINDKKQFGV